MIEPATREDRGPVVDSWLKSYRLSPYAGLVPMDQWGGWMSSVIDDILDRSQTIVYRVGQSQAGWLCFEPDDLCHYIYVWAPYREHSAKITAALIDEAGLVPRFTYSCSTPTIEAIFRELSQRPKFNPLPARFGERPRRKEAKAPRVEYRRSGRARGGSDLS